MFQQAEPALFTENQTRDVLFVTQTQREREIEPNNIEVSWRHVPSVSRQKRNGAIAISTRNEKKRLSRISMAASGSYQVG